MTPASLPRVLAALALLAVSACGAAEAAPPGEAAAASAAPAYEPHPATRLVDRLAQAHADALPDLTGTGAGRAVAALRARGLSARVMSYDRGPVSAQYPEPGAAPPRDGVVLLWTGTPPAPPPPAPPAPPPDPPDPEPDPPEPEPDPPEPEPNPPEPDPDPPEPAGASPDPDAAPEPGATRVSPRRLPGRAPGEVLEGLASWYGPAFAGRTTACGGVFDPGGLTLATRELRCGTRVRVTGPSGATVEAVATDWGPAEWTGRRFDLSRATFEAIHPLGAGVARVTVEVLAP